ncbi:MAG: TRAP transporter small permease [Burkholderiaceae bacterium]|nr:TRAP transporter small permease [Burkholderiaceae bacterium]
MSRLIKTVSQVLGIIAAVGLLAMMILTFVDVVGRYGFHKAVFGAAEIIEHLMVLTIFAGLAFVTARNDHITVTLFDPWIERHFPFFRRWVVVGFSLACYLLVTWQLFEHGIALLRSGKRTPVFDVLQWYQPMTAAVLSIIGLVLFALAVIHTRGRLGIQTHVAGASSNDVNANQTSV